MRIGSTHSPATKKIFKSNKWNNHHKNRAMPEQTDPAVLLGSIYGYSVNISNFSFWVSCNVVSPLANEDCGRIKLIMIAI